MEKPMVLHQAQREIVRDDHRFRVVITGRRFGKTIVAVNELVGKALLTNNAIVAYIAPTNEDVRDIVWRELKKVAEPVTTKCNDVRMELEITNKFGGTSIIKTASWQSIIDKGRLRGQKFHFLVMDEVSSYKNFWVGWEEVIRPTLTDYKGEVLFIGTPKGYNHFYDLYQFEKDKEDFKSFKYSSYDNPYIPKEEIDTARQQMTEDRFAQEYLGDFRRMEGLVFKEFDRERHTFDDKHILPDFTDIIVGVDFGYTNPATIVKIGIDRDSNFWILDEWYKTKQSTQQIIEKAKSFNPNMVYPDPAEPDRIAQMEESGLNIREVSKDVKAGINWIRELFKANRIKINNNCVNLINELETYHYKEWKNQDTNAPEEPEKKDDHAVDAMRYALYMHRPAEIMDNDFNLYNAVNFE